MTAFHIFLILAPSTEMLISLIFLLRTIQGWEEDKPCSSKPKHVTSCPIGNASVITEVRLLQNSGLTCVRSTIHPDDMKQMSDPVYGYRDNFVWVANGCNATFRVQYNVASTVSTTNIDDASSIKTTTSDQLMQQLCNEYMYAGIVSCILTFICVTFSVVILWRRRQHRKCLYKSRYKTATQELKVMKLQAVNNDTDNTPKIRRIECINGSAQDREHDLQSVNLTVESEELDGHAFFYLGISRGRAHARRKHT